MNLEELRRHLAPAVKRFGEKRLVLEDEQIRVVESLRDRFEHSITLVSKDSEVWRPAGESVSCYEFALGLFEHSRYWEIWKAALCKIPAQGLLIEDLITAGLERLDSARENALVVYRSDCFGHVGRARGNKVQSKWSPGGCVWDHAPLEVPQVYGGLWGYYASPSIDETLTIFAGEMSGTCKRALEWYHAH